MKQQNFKILLAFGAIYIIWGSTYLATRFAIETIPPLTMIGIRSLAAGIILFSISRSRNEETIKRENIIPLVALGAMFFLIGHGLLAWSQQYVPSGNAAVLVTPEPLWIMGLEWFFLKDTKIKIKGISGLLLGFVGVVFLITLTAGNDVVKNNILGSVLIVVSTISWGAGAVYSRVASVPKSPILTSAMELIFGGILVLITSCIIGEQSHFHLTQVTLKSIFGLLYLIVFGSVVAFSAYVWLLGRTSVTKISTHTYINPVIAVFLGWLFANEKITLGLSISTVIIIISVYIVLSDKGQDSKKNSIRQSSSS